MKRKTSAALLLAVVLALGLVLGSLLRTPEDVAAQNPAAPSRTESELEELRGFADNLSALFRAASESAGPAVVWIATERTVVLRRSATPFNDPFFEQFMGPQEREFKQPGLGSGVILDAEGFVLTNNHVVAGAEKLEVKLGDAGESTYKARLVGADPKTDLAVIKIEDPPKNLPVVKLGDSDQLQVGDWVLAIGNPLGFAHTVSAGIVSAKGRTLGMAAYENLIQTDAAINPGNSGGALVNLHGEVVGINTAIVSGTGGYQGLGFAIPVNMAKEVLERLKKGEEIERGFLGIYGQDLTGEAAAKFKYEGTEGALVNEVSPDTPAEKAGVKAGDIVAQWDGKKVKDFAALRRMVASTEPGRKVPVKIWRDGAEKDLTVELARLADYEGTSAFDLLGLKVEAVTPEVRSQFGRSKLQGVLVAEVSPNSTAANAGIEAGDVILSLNRRPVASVADYAARLAEVKKGEVVVVHVLDQKTGRAAFLFLRTG